MCIRKFLDSGYPAVFVSAADDSSVNAELTRSGRRLFTFSAAGFLVDTSTGESEQSTFAGAFAAVSVQTESVLLVRDCQAVIKNGPIYRALLDAAAALKSNGSAVVLVAPHWTLPAELQHFAPIVSQPLPTRDELGAPLLSIMESAGIDPATISDQRRAALLDAAAGLTAPEAENAFALSLVESGKLSPWIVEREKMRLVASTGYLTVEKPAELDTIGGLQELKNYLADEVAPTLRDEQLRARGILLAGLPGLGKSLGAKATGAALRRPIVRLDISGCKGSLVGQSEANLRNALALCEAIAPCVVWIDEIEKAVGGAAGGGVSDGGTSVGMLGYLLTWLQEHDKPIFVVATCNDYNALPPELTRAGRFDERFCVDLPTASERREIATVHLTRLGCDAELASTIADRTANYTGAEIEQLIKSAARLTGRKINAPSIDRAAASIRPIAVTAKDKVDAFRQWARKALRPANAAETEPQRVNGNRAALSSSAN